MTLSGYGVSFGGNENVLKLDCGDGCKTANTISRLFSSKDSLCWGRVAGGGSKLLLENTPGK